jgi:hypothetical protein
MRLLVAAFAPRGPLLIGVDDTIERRRGARIKAKGIYRDPVRSSRSHFVKTSGLRWLSLMLLVKVPFAQRVWALPFLSVLAPSLRYQQQHTPLRQRQKTLSDWTRQALLQVRRWWPLRPLVVVADANFAVLDLLDALRRTWRAKAITVVTRLRLDAALYEPAPVARPGRIGRPRLKGSRLPTLQQRIDDESTSWMPLTVSHWYGRVPHGQVRQATRQVHFTRRRLEIATGTAVWYHNGKLPVPLRWVLIRDPAREFETQAPGTLWVGCTDQNATPARIITWYVQRWQVEVTYHEVREHLGVETQRQWNDSAIARTTPVLLGLFSLVTLLAQRLVDQQVPRVPTLEVRQSAWYIKPAATFSDALAWVRRYLWMHAQTPFCMSHFRPNSEKLRQVLLERMTDLLCYAP